MGSQQVVNDRVHAGVISGQFDRVCEADDVLSSPTADVVLDNRPIVERLEGISV